MLVPGHASPLAYPKTESSHKEVGFQSRVALRMFSPEGLDISAAFLLLLDREAGVLTGAEGVAAGAGVEKERVSETDTFRVWGGAAAVEDSLFC